MRKGYQKSLKEIECHMLEMGSYAEEAMTVTLEGLLNRDFILSQKVIENDFKIDAYEERIEKEIISLMTLQHPIAKDFRRISSVYKIITDIERIGDLCVNISRISINIGTKDFVQPLKNIPVMFQKSIEMLSDALEAYVELDLDLAKQVTEHDEEINYLNRIVQEEFVEFVLRDSASIKEATNLMFISRYIERIGDHIKNICKRVIYIETNHKNFGRD